jgi:hypothetical protein
MGQFSLHFFVRNRSGTRFAPDPSKVPTQRDKNDGKNPKFT